MSRLNKTTNRRIPARLRRLAMKFVTATTHTTMSEPSRHDRHPSLQESGKEVDARLYLFGAVLCRLKFIS